MICTCTLKANANNFLMKGHSVAINLQEMYKTCVDKNLRTLRMEKDFIEEYYTTSSLLEFKESLLQLNPYVQVILPNSSTIDIEETDEVDDILRMKDVEELIDFVMLRSDSLKTIQKALLETVDAKNEILKATSKMGSTYLQLANQNLKYSSLESMYNKTVRNLELSNMKLQTLLTRINKNHGINISEDKMLGIRTRDGIGFKKILYLKEVTRIRYMDTMLYYLREILRTLYNYPVRYLVIESTESVYKSRLYPECTPYHTLTAEDVWQADIFMAGFQQRLVEDVCSNMSNADFLIVLDRSGWEFPYIVGENVKHMCTVSDVDDLPVNMYPDEDVITYSRNYNYISHIKDFNNLSVLDKMKKYSSMPIIKKLIQVMEET